MIMKKFRFLLPLMVLSMLSVACKPDELSPDDSGGAKSVATFTHTELVAAVDEYSKAWDADPVIPETMTVSGKELTFPQYVYAFAKLIVDIKDGKTSNVDVLNFKAPTYPDRDSYDKKEIAVYNDAKGEDLGTIAKSMIDAMNTKGQVPNQTLIDRNGTALAYSTNRAAVTFARAISIYHSEGKMPAAIKTDYLSTSSTIKGFASQIVQYMRKWEETVGTVSADGSRNSGRIPPNPWENAHFIPIPWHTGCQVAADGQDQYHIQYQPYLEIDVAGQKYNAAQAFGVSLAALLDLVTKEGSSVKQTVITEPVHTPGNGANFDSPIPAVQAGYAWGPHPWYENASENGPLKYNGELAQEVGIDFIIKAAPWVIARATSDLGRYPNYFTFGTGALELEGFTGYACPMRIFVISLRFWDYIVKNNITENVYDALKDVKVPADLYGSEQPPLALDKESAIVAPEGEVVTVKVISKDQAWTATTENDFLTIEPASGEAGETEVKITVAPNAGAARSGKVVFTLATGSVKQISISQDPTPNFASVEDFIKQAVTYLDVWKRNIGTVKADGTKTFTDAHFIPIPFREGASGGDGVNQYDPAYQPYHTITVGGQELNAAQTFGTAVATLVDLLTVEGSTHLQAEQNTLVHTAGNGKKLADMMPAVKPYYAWGPHPWYEVDSPISYNGEEMQEADINFVLRIAPWIINKIVGVGETQNPSGRYPNFYTFGSSAITYEGYTGYLSPMRMFLITLRYLDYIVKNNITENVYDALKDVKVSADLYGLGKETPTLKGWAKEFVKCLDIWAETVGTVEADGTMRGAKAFTDAHFIPIAEPKGNANGNVGNQYDAQYADKIWELTYGEETYTSSQAWEISIRGLLNMVTAEGEAGLPAMDDRNKAWTLANNASLSTAAVPSASTNNKWGEHPWYEVDNPVKYNGTDVEEVGLDFVVKACSWHVVRGLVTTAGNASPLNKVGNFQEFGTKSSQLILDGYAGYICPMRELLIVARIYKYLLDNNIDSNVYDAIKDVKFDYSLYYTK